MSLNLRESTGPAGLSSDDPAADKLESLAIEMRRHL